MLQGAIAGLASGGLYAVLALCLTLMYRLVRVVNFAQACNGMFGAFVAVWLVKTQNWSVIPASLVGLVVGALLAGILGWIVATWLAEVSISTRSAVTIGPLLLLISLSFILFGNKPQPFQPIIEGVAFQVIGVTVSWLTVTTVALAIVIAIAARLVLSATDVGTKLRALSERPTTAELIGIPAKPLSIAVWMVTGLLSALVVIIIAPAQANDATGLSMLVVPAAAAALVGGFKRLDLSVIGGLALGAATGLVAQIGSLSAVREFLPFLVIVGFLLWMQRKEVWDEAR